MQNDILDNILDDSLAAAQARNRPEIIRRRSMLARWSWLCFLGLLFFAGTPSFIMYNWGPSEVNNYSPIDAYILVFGLFGIAGLVFIALIVLLIWRGLLGRSIQKQ